VGRIDLYTSGYCKLCVDENNGRVVVGEFDEDNRTHEF